MLIINKGFLKRAKKETKTHKVTEIDHALLYLEKMIDKFRQNPEKKKQLEIEYCFLKAKKVSKKILLKK